jgi:glycosyltransferase involved in cell wall biosynthesis
MAKYQRTIGLINRYSDSGHHESWLAIYVQLLLKNNYQVVVVTPNVENFEANLIEIGIDPHCRGLIVVKNNLILMKEILHSILRPIKKSIKKCIDIFYLDIKNDSKSESEISYSDQSLYSGFVNKRYLDRIVAMVWRRLNIKLDFLFFMYLDDFSCKSYDWSGVQYSNRVSWGGIRFSPFKNIFHVGEEGYLYDEYFFGMCFLDRNSCYQYQQKICNKQFTFLPDVTNTSLPANSSSELMNIKSLVNDRKLIFLGGSIESRKNVKLFCESAQIFDEKKYFFLIAGKVEYQTFSDEELIALQNFQTSSKGNTLLINRRFKDESQLNALIELSSVIFAVYKGFNQSSNMLAKAAYFRRPVLVSQNSLMGEIVESSQIGRAVDGSSIDDLAKALNGLDESPVDQSCFADYQKKSSLDLLEHQLISFLQKARLHND